MAASLCGLLHISMGLGMCGKGGNLCYRLSCHSLISIYTEQYMVGWEVNPVNERMKESAVTRQGLFFKA